MARNNNNPTFPAKIIKINNSELVFNRGSAHGISYGDRFLVYRLGEELFDPDTNASLGTLEIVIGRGKVVHVQEHLTTIISDSYDTKVVEKYSPLSPLSGHTQEEIRVNKPFKNPKENDLVRPL